MPGKISSFEGPKSSRKISKQISLDCKERNIELSDKDVYDIIGFFFRHIVLHMKKGDFIIVDELGKFGMDPKTKKIREKKELLKELKKRKLARLRNARRTYNRVLKVRWRGFNDMRASKDLEPWSFHDWLIVNKLKKRSVIQGINKSLLK